MLCWQLCPALISRCWCYLPVLLPDICPQISPLFTQHSSFSISSSIIGDKIAGRPKLNWTLSGFKLILLARPLPLIVWTEGRRFQNPGNAKEWRVGLTHANHSKYVNLHHILNAFVYPAESCEWGDRPHRDGSVHLGFDYFIHRTSVCFNQVHASSSPSSSSSSSSSSSAVGSAWFSRQLHQGDPGRCERGDYLQIFPNILVL